MFLGYKNIYYPVGYIVGIYTNTAGYRVLSEYNLHPITSSFKYMS